MMHQMNRSATARKIEDPDGFRRTPVSVPLPRRGTDAGRRRGQSAVSSLCAGFELTQEVEPELSKIPGVKRYLKHYGREIVPNANTLEDSLDQYDSMIKEKILADPCRADPRWLQIQPSSNWWPGSASGQSSPASPMVDSTTANCRADPAEGSHPPPWSGSASTPRPASSRALTRLNRGTTRPRRCLSTPTGSLRLRDGR
jgi:hypothetical protein